MGIIRIFWQFSRSIVLTVCNTSVEIARNVTREMGRYRLIPVLDARKLAVGCFRYIDISSVTSTASRIIKVEYTSALLVGSKLGRAVE